MFSQSLQTSRGITIAIGTVTTLVVALLGVANMANAETKSNIAHVAHAVRGSTSASVVSVGANQVVRPHYTGRYNYGRRGFYGGYYGGYWNSFYFPGLYLGLTVPFLPFGYSTYWYGGSPYYGYDNVYYMADRDGYRVIDRPGESTLLPPGPAPVVAAPPVLNGPSPSYVQQPVGQLYAYPRNNQTATQATFDRIECERWGTQQTGFQPTQSPDNAALKSDYQRAVSACLEGRDYTVK